MGILSGASGDLSSVARKSGSGSPAIAVKKAGGVTNTAKSIPGIKSAAKAQAAKLALTPAGKAKAKVKAKRR